MVDTIFKRPLYVVAEIANAAQGDKDAYTKLIDAAQEAGADAVKFQFYKYDELATPAYPKYENLRKTFYTEDERISFIEYARRRKIDIIIDVFDRWGLAVVKKVSKKIKAVKVPPAVTLDADLLHQVLGLGLPTLIGIGGIPDEDINEIAALLSGYDNPVVFLCGFQGFPTKMEDTSLARIPHIKKKYGYPVGFADHIDAESSFALRIPEYAFFSGANIIEKHITLSRSAKGLDYYSSLEPEEFNQMVENLKKCCVIKGTVGLSAAQKEYRKHATRITTARAIKKNEIIFKKNIAFKRTGKGNALFPNQTDDFFPAIALRDLKEQTGIRGCDVKKAVAGVVCVCRLHSKRLPRKALLELWGIPVIERCLMNTLQSELSQLTILATSTNSDDEELAHHALGGKVKFFKGSLDDPAARMLEAANTFGIDIIVRVTGDSPLISYELIDILLRSHFETGSDFSFYKDAPLGARSEVITKAALERLMKLIDTEGYSEYLTLFFKNNPEYFKLNEVVCPKIFRYPRYRLNLDYPQDYEFLKALFEKLPRKSSPVRLSEVIRILKKYPDIAAINGKIKPCYVQGNLAKKLYEVTRIKKP